LIDWKSFLCSFSKVPFKYRDVTGKAPVHISRHWVISGARLSWGLSPLQQQGCLHTITAPLGTLRRWNFLCNIHYLYAPKHTRVGSFRYKMAWLSHLRPQRCSTSFFHLSSRTKPRPLYYRLKETSPWGWIKMRRCAEAVPGSRVEGAGMTCTTSSSQTFNLAWRGKRHSEFGRLLKGVR
jgi:hypothetical protein